MPHWQNRRERERVEKRDRRRENKEGREHGGQHRVSLSILPQEKKKLKIPSSFFSTKGGSEQRRESAR